MFSYPRTVRSSLHQMAVGAPLLIIALSANALMIDDFSTGEFQHGDFSYFYQTYMNSTAADVLDGWRAAGSTNNDGFRVANGVFSYDSAVQYGPLGSFNQYYNPEPGAWLTYGYNPSAPEPGIKPFDLSGYSGIDVTFANVANDFTLTTFGLTWDGNPSLETGGFSYSTLVHQSAGPQVVHLPFDQFDVSSIGDWAHAINLQFNFFNDGNPVAVTVDEIKTAEVPEPASFLLLLGGLGLQRLMRRRGASAAKS
jgi:hypothetical protein